MISFALFGGALGLRLLFADWLEPNRFLTFYPAVAAAALLGWREGSLVAFLSALAAWFFFIEPRYSFTTTERNFVPIFLGFLFVSGFLIWIIQLLRATARGATGRSRRTHRGRGGASRGRPAQG
jgi:K+-sensing histidine kinase KdpD